MKRDVLVVGTEYLIKSGRGSVPNYFEYLRDESSISWGTQIGELIDASPFRKSGYYGYTFKTLEEALAKKSEFSHSDTRNALFKTIAYDGSEAYEIVPLNQIKMSVPIWKRISVNSEVDRLGQEASVARAKVIRESCRRNFHKKQGKAMRNQMRKINRKFGVDLNEFMTKVEFTKFHNVPMTLQRTASNRVSYTPAETDEFVKVPYETFIKLLEAASCA